MNSNGYLIYIDRDRKIKSLSYDLRKRTTFLKCDYPHTKWKPVSVQRSPFSGDVLVGMYESVIFRPSESVDKSELTGKVARYTNIGELKQTMYMYERRISENSTHLKLYCFPHYITENNNGDIVVSDSGKHAVVVTDSEGNLRFSYTGPRSILSPKGICTDPLSHILLCEGLKVQIIDKDGHFLAYLLDAQPGMFFPQCLYYDANCHLLWVGSSLNNEISIYKYITRNSVLLGKCAFNYFQLPYRWSF